MLPTSSNLSAKIREALEESEFLIVLCSKETKEAVSPNNKMATYSEKNTIHVCSLTGMETIIDITARNAENELLLLTSTYGLDGTVLMDQDTPQCKEIINAKCHFLNNSICIFFNKKYICI